MSEFVDPVPKRRGNVRDKLRKLFETAQEQTSHQTLVDKCKKLYRKCGDVSVFLMEFTTVLRYCFVYGDKIAVEKMLNFAAKFAVSVYLSEKQSDESEEDSLNDDMGPFVTGLLDFLFKSHAASWADSRLRCVQLINKILSTMPENCSISNDIWKKLSDAMLIRIQDRNANVRVQAVLTARKLQDPKDTKCEIIEAFVFHLNDPIPAVRRAVVSSIALNKANIGYVLSRTRDVNENVRRNAYVVFAKVRITSLTIKYRLTILGRGLKDRSEMVQNCVKKVLVTNWLENLNKDILKFLDALDVVTDVETSVLTLQAIFSNHTFEEVIPNLAIDKETHVIPLENLTPESALLWRCLAQFLLSADREEELESIIPNLSYFCEYVRSYFSIEENIEESCSASPEDQWAGVQRKHILMQLLQLFKVFDLGDEMGRNNLKKLLIYLLISPKVHNSAVECLIELLTQVVPDTNLLLEEVLEVISEIREPINQVPVEMPPQERMKRERQIASIKVNLNELREEEHQAAQDKNFLKAQSLKEQIENLESELESLCNQSIGMTQEVREEKNDPKTLCKCLTIIVQTMKHCSVKSLTPTLRSLLDNFVQLCLTNEDLETQSLAIHALAQFCIVDRELSKDKLYLFIMMIAQNNDSEICVPALKAVFDLIQKYGIESFEPTEHSFVEDDAEGLRKSRTLLMEDEFEYLNESLREDNSISQHNGARYISVLKTLLESNKTSDEMRMTTYEGLCKLLASGIITSSTLLSRIIILGFSPIIDNDTEDFIRQVFIVFFPIFASKNPQGQEMIEKAFIPTLRAIVDATVGSPNADINPKDVASFLIAHTKAEFNEFTSKTLHVHNNLALAICHELLRDPRSLIEKGFVDFYLKSLVQLDLSLDSDTFKNQLLSFVDKLDKAFYERKSKQLIIDFKKKVENSSLSNVQSVENTLATTDNEETVTSLDSRRSSNVSNNVTSSSLKRRITGNSKLSTVSEVLEESRISDFSSPSVCSKSNKPGPERQVIPESPEISEQSFSSQPSDNEPLLLSGRKTRQSSQRIKNLQALKNL